MHRLALASGLAAASVLACTAEPAIVSDDGGFARDTTDDGGDDGDDGDDDGPPSDDGMTDDGMAPAEPVCGNDIIDGEDVCDGTALGDTSCQSLGFERGQIGCTANCGGYDLSDCGFFECGNGDQEGEEDCDGTVGKATCVSEGFDNGTLFCTMDCEYDTDRCGICGDGDVADEEDCDTDEDFDETCQGLGFMTGDLECGDDCLWDTSNCSTCGNGMQEGDEDCDGEDVPGKTCDGEGFDSGVLGCTDTCDYDFTACGTCGNDILDGDEACDNLDFGAESCVTQGFDSGSLSCDAACGTIGTDNCGTCGNDTIDGAEACDGADFGGETCASIGLQGGTLGCSGTCSYDFSGCDLQGIPFGSDAFYDGLALETVLLPCDEISGTGTDLGLGDDDEAVVSLPFTFSFYGTDYTEVTVGSNGTLNFGDPFEPGLSNSCLPDAFDLNNIAVFWDDLDPPDGVGGGVRHESFGATPNQRFVVQWDAPNFGGDLNDLIRVQAMLHESGAIDMCYVDTINAGNSNDNGADSTAGIQGDAMTAVQYSCNTPDLIDGLWLMFIPN